MRDGGCFPLLPAASRCFPPLFSKHANYFTTKIALVVQKRKKLTDDLLLINPSVAQYFFLKVVGAWVKDKPKGWNEIHPAWKVVQK
jgi:hypothetical protein